MSSYFRRATEFDLLTRGRELSWRQPQLGAIGSLLAHWSLHPGQPALVSLPTGVGKTAVAMAAPFLERARRVLVVAPSAELRRQLTRRFADLVDLRRIGAVPDKPPKGLVVREVKGRLSDWSDLAEADVVVGLPHSLSPVHYDVPPPADLFDLFVCDEAHHLPAPTWRAILEHFDVRNSLLLTATPTRRDGRRIPGDLVYHYPLRRALDESLFQPVEPRILEIPSDASREDIDRVIAEEATAILDSPRHQSSAALVRVQTKQRAKEIAALYGELGLEVQVLHSGLSPTKQRSITESLTEGDLRAVAVVGMLIEGFDLPRLRLAAYHDKHKSLPATAQLVGRLARVDSEFPQNSVLVTARDIDIYPALEGQVRRLYEEDGDWAQVLPGILDSEIREAAADESYASDYDPPTPQYSLAAIHPLSRAVIYEAAQGWEPAFLGEVPDSLKVGKSLAGQSIVYSGLSAANDTLMLLTATTKRPRWHADPGLDATIHDLHMMSFRRSPRTGDRDLLMLNTGNTGVARELTESLVADETLTLADPEKLQAVFDSLPRIAASNIGVRGRYAGFGGAPSYRMYAGSDIERGLRETDTAHGALGHAMIQVADDGPAFTAGLSTGKAKYWETRYTSLREYDEFITALAERYWEPQAAPAGPLLPSVARGERLVAWPKTPVLSVELDPITLTGGWSLQVGESVPLETLEFRVKDQTDESISVVASFGNVTHWSGSLLANGQVVPTGADAKVARGFASPVSLSELLSDRPPTVYFIDGTTVRGTVRYDSRTSAGFLQVRLEPCDWTDVDMEAETRMTASRRGKGVSVDENLEDYLRTRPRRAKRRWVIGNDGAGEIADYLVIEIDPGPTIRLELWHAKAAGGPSPSLRVTDLEVAVAQAIKSRRWITSRGLWTELGARLTGSKSPPATVVDGNEQLLRILCGESSRWQELALTRLPPVIASAEIWIAQPGLSKGQLEEKLAASQTSLSSAQIRQLLCVLHDATAEVAQACGVLCSD